MSEVTGPGTAVVPHAPRMGTVGIPSPGVEARPEEDGELLVRGGNVMVGYYKSPEQTAEAIDTEGWLHTADVADADSDGHHRIVDRKKELIITAGGKNISPANRESMMKHHPLICQAVCVGDARKFLSALVVLDPDAAATWAHARGIDGRSIAELAAHPDVVAEIARGLGATNARVSRAEQIKRLMILPAEWTAESEELTPTLKVRRRVVDRKYVSEIEAMYSKSPLSGQ